MFDRQLSSSKRYEVIFSGNLREGFAMEEVKLAAAETGLINSSEVENIISNAGPAVLYKSNSKKKALEASKLLSTTGLRCKLRKRHEDCTPAHDWNTDKTPMIYVAPIIITLTVLYILIIS